MGLNYLISNPKLKRLHSFPFYQNFEWWWLKHIPHVIQFKRYPAKRTRTIVDDIIISRSTLWSHEQWDVISNAFNDICNAAQYNHTCTWDEKTRTLGYSSAKWHRFHTNIVCSLYTALTAHPNASHISQMLASTTSLLSMAFKQSHIVAEQYGSVMKRSYNFGKYERFCNG